MSTALQTKSWSQYDPIHLLGHIQSIRPDGHYEVSCDGYLWTCTRAASCLLVPQLQDTVLISGPHPEQVYLIAIITQAEPNRQLIQGTGELVVQSEQLSLHSQQNLRLSAEATLLVQSEQLQLATEQAQCAVHEMDYVGKRLHSQIGIVRLLGRVYESIVDRLSFMSKSSYKVTETVEHSRAGTLDMQAEQSARIHSKYTMVTGKDLVKVDAKQIHMG